MRNSDSRSTYDWFPRLLEAVRDVVASRVACSNPACLAGLSYPAKKESQLAWCPWARLLNLQRRCASFARRKILLQSPLEQRRVAGWRGSRRRGTKGDAVYRRPVYWVACDRSKKACPFAVTSEIPPARTSTRGLPSFRRIFDLPPWLLLRLRDTAVLYATSLSGYEPKNLLKKRRIFRECRCSGPFGTLRNREHEISNIEGTPVSSAPKGLSRIQWYCSDLFRLKLEFKKLTFFTVRDQWLFCLDKTLRKYCLVSQLVASV